MERGEIPTIEVMQVGHQVRAAHCKRKWVLLIHLGVIASIAVAAVRISLPWNVCICALCNQSLIILCCQLDSKCISDVLESSMGTTETCQQPQIELM